MPSQAAERRRLLIFEPDAEGHSLEWLEHLIRYRDPATEISIVAPTELCRALRCAGDAAVRTIALTPREAALCVRRPLSLAAFTRWRLMQHYLRQTGAGHGFFLTIDLLAMPLALGLGFGGPTVSGILFRPSVHYAALGPYRPSLGERLRDWRKDVFYRLMLRNRALARVLSLDPFFPAYARRRYPNGTKVEVLPDPAQQPIERTAPAACGEPEFVPRGRIGFLLFGYLAERKGPLAVLDALALLKPEIAGRVAVLLAGKVDPAIADRLEHGYRALARSQPALWLRLDGRRLDDGELAELIRRSDVVLAPYQRFVGSSGVLLWAARSGRPVLAQDFGLVGRLTRDHGLGLAVDCRDPAAIAAEIVRMVEHGPAAFFDRAAAARFADAQTPQRFASLVLSV
jgi:glycosyltransferase involved in cell wall biosynthesis